MKSHVLWLAPVALVLAACGEQQPTEPQPAAEAPATPAAVADEAPVVPAVDEEFLDHMHRHADQLDELMFALSDGDLVAAMTPAYWLSRHDSVEGVPDEWQPHLVGMREAALKIESVHDLDSARALAEEVSTHCQACHLAAGVDQTG